MLGQKNITHVVVGKDVNLVNETSTRASMTVGQIGIFKAGSATAINGTTDLVAGDRFKIVFKDVDGYLVESPLINYDNIVSKSAVAYSADTEQKSYIGYNGSSGAIAVNNSADYYIHLDRRDGTKTWGEYNLYKMLAAYRSDATATQTEIVDALIKNATKNLLVEKIRSGRVVTQVGRINSATVTAANAFTGNTTVVKGSNTIVVAESVTTNDAGIYNTNKTIAVGDYIRIGGVGVGTTLKSNVYKVVSVSGTATAAATIVLDIPVLEASGTYAAATVDVEVIPSATAIAANWGIMVESLPVKFVPGLFKNAQVSFVVALSEAFSGTPVTLNTPVFKGSGTYEEVAENEWLLKGNRGEPYRVASYPVHKNLNAVPGKEYDTINLVFTNDNSTDLNNVVKSWIGLVIYTENESVSTVHTDLKDVLNIA